MVEVVLPGIVNLFKGKELTAEIKEEKRA